MGNYKSRPTNSCSEEHLKKINELHLHVAQKISSDLQLLEPSSLTDLQESCCRAEVLTRSILLITTFPCRWRGSRCSPRRSQSRR